MEAMRRTTLSHLLGWQRYIKAEGWETTFCQNHFLASLAMLSYTRMQCHEIRGTDLTECIAARTDVATLEQI